jgi:hypothetical protein
MASKKQTLEQLMDLQKRALTVNKMDPVDGSRFVHNDFRAQIEEAKPSGDPEYWAKSNCKLCHGRGIMGTTTSLIGGTNKLVTPQTCSCASAAWQKWQDDFVEKLLEEKRKAETSNTTTAPGAETLTKADPKVANALERIEQLSTHIAKLQANQSELELRSAALPQRQELKEAQEGVLQVQEVAQTQQKIVQDLQSQIERFDAAAEDLQVRAKLAMKKAAAARQLLKSEAKPAAVLAQQQVEAASGEVDLAKKRLSQADHQLRRKIREIEKKVAKFNARIARVQSENNLHHSVFIAEEAEAFVDHDTTPANG